MISFLLNQDKQTVSDIDPNTTVLDYLREHLQLTGTKEGCASGDCGACTVVVASPTADKKNIEYQSVNACISLLGTLHGKQLITVEHLQEGQKLHPCQQAMVDCHASQCGFCTPGFVMSLFAYGKNYPVPERNSVISDLGGNLCRCTGYRPIIDAALKMYESDSADQFERQQENTLENLLAIEQESELIALSGADRQFLAPTNTDQLAELLLEYPEARLIGGGTDLSLELTQALRNIDVLISTGLVDDMKVVTEDEQSVTIGGATSYTAAESVLVSAYPDMQELLDRLGSKQIRNRGTLGGNIGNASPIADLPPVLIVLQAQLILRKGQQRRTVAVEDFYTSYKKTVLQASEFIEQIVIPKHSEGDLLKIYKISKRFDDDISTSCAAIKVHRQGDIVQSASIAYGGMAEVPKRAKHCEQALVGQPWTEESIEQAMRALEKDFDPISDFRASATYRLTVSKNLLLRYFHETSGLPVDNLRVTHHG